MAKRYYWLYTVSGQATFPLDMLRYDRATPHEQSDVTALSFALRRTGYIKREGEHLLRLFSYREPTVGRWASFGWKVSDVVRREAP